MSNLDRLNAYRVAQGLDPVKDFRPARHQQFLDTIVVPWEEMIAANAAKLNADKIPTYKEFARYDKSAVEKPVAFVHSFLDQHGGELTRKEAMHALVKVHGVNYSTARTQYQRWYAEHKASK